VFWNKEPDRTLSHPSLKSHSSKIYLKVQQTTYKHYGVLSYP